MIKARIMTTSSICLWSFEDKSTGKKFKGEAKDKEQKRGFRENRIQQFTEEYVTDSLQRNIIQHEFMQKIFVSDQDSYNNTPWCHIFCSVSC